MSGTSSDQTIRRRSAAALFGRNSTVPTVGTLREFVAACDEVGIPDRVTPDLVHGRIFAVHEEVLPTEPSDEGSTSSHRGQDSPEVHG